MKYIIIGAGGTGGILGFYMTKAGKDVTLIARNAHLEAMKKQGLSVQKMWTNETETIPVSAESMESYEAKGEKADVILVCVKKYSLDSCIPFIQNISHKNTIVVPVLNVYGTGAYLQEKLPELLVTDGCIYVSANIKQPGVLLQHGEILRVFFGVREKEDLKKLNGQSDGEYKAERLLKKIAQDFKDSGIDGILSDNIKRDALTKFSYVSPIGTAGLYLHAVAGDFQREGEARELFKTLIREIVTLANAMGITFEEDLVERNLKILSNLPEEATTSMQRDVMEGKQSEIDGLVYEVVRMAEKYGAEVPAYRRTAEKFREMGVK
ncbi:MAG: ketopantoate reductase family protein [Anaerobutyricum hallii]|uniref:ketopantoate reductase family protein n=1 Tax=Anaerobutyricum hallii TaxID=39488 RepID=UPI00242F5BC4|nr:2-dehydropantoate 2-reductase [Anaerobutyricum hallii]HJH97187.1 2-dehydropantoate 2-reductase [Anaerobutyricum hallii]